MNSKSRIIIPNEIPTNLKQLHGLKNILLNTTKPTKYIVTLKPRRTNLKTPNLEAQKVFINADNLLKRKPKLDAKFVLRTPILEKIDEQSEKSTSSIETDNCDLKPAQSITNFNRLKGGWSLVSRRNSKKSENESNPTNNNERPTTEPADNVIVNEGTEEILNMEETTSQIESLPNNATKIDHENIKETKNEKKVTTGNDRDNHELQPLTNNDDMKENLRLNQQPVFEKESKSVANNSEVNRTSAKSFITSSFIETMLDEMVRTSETLTLPSTSIKCAVKDLIPICGETNKTHSPCNPLDINSNDVKLTSELFCILPDDKECCKRIEDLENQVEIFHLELQNLQKELIPLDDVAKFSVLSRQFNEINNMLMELKLNCLKLQNIEFQGNVKSETSFREEMGQFYDCTQDYLCPHAYLETCNCNIFQNSSYFPSETAKIENPEYYSERRSKKKYAERSSHRHDIPQSRIKGFEYPQTNFGCSCCQHCLFYRDFNANERYFLQTQPDTYSSPQLIQDKRSSRPEIDKYVVNDWISNPDKSTSSQTHNRINEEGIRLNSIASGKNEKQNHNNIQKSKREANQSSKNSYNTTTRHFAGKEILSNPLSTAEERFLSNDLSFLNTNLQWPLITNNLSKAIWKIIGNIESENIALAVFLESNNLYYINVSITQTGECLGCLYSNKWAFKEAKKKKFFDKFLTFFVLNAMNTIEQRNTILGHSFEFINDTD